MNHTDPETTPERTTHACAPPVRQEVRADIERTLRTRHVGHGKIAFALEDRAKIAGEKLWVHLKRHPYAGIGTATALGLTVASMTGVGELAVAVLCGYAAYEVLRRGQPADEAVMEVVRDIAKMA